MADDDAAGPKSEPQRGDSQSVEGGEAASSPPDGTATEVDRLRAELASVRDRALRERAELENVKKRAAREKSEALRFANEGLLRDLLPVIDNLHRAIEHA